jgi:hypothetical protein
MSRGFDGFEMDDFRDSSGSPKLTAEAGNQAEEEAVVRKLRPSSG